MEEFQGNFATVLLGLVGFLVKVFPRLLFSPIFILPSPFSEGLPAKALRDHADRNENNLFKAYFSSASVPPGPWPTDRGVSDHAVP